MSSGEYGVGGPETFVKCFGVTPNLGFFINSGTFKGFGLSIKNLILECDIVLTIDNTLAHLSSSLGQNTWILLPYSANFRWFENTSNSLWYKSSTLIRQTPDRKWKTSIDEIITKLKTTYLGRDLKFLECLILVLENRYHFFITQK